MPLENRKRKNISPFWECFNQTLSKYIPAENKIRRNKNSEDFLLNTKQVLSARNLENFLGEYEDKILGFQVEPVPAKPPRPSYKFQKLRHFV